MRNRGEKLIFEPRIRDCAPHGAAGIFWAWNRTRSYPSSSEFRESADPFGGPPRKAPRPPNPNRLMIGSFPERPRCSPRRDGSPSSTGLPKSLAGHEDRPKAIRRFGASAPEVCRHPDRRGQRLRGFDESRAHVGARRDARSTPPSTKDAIMNGGQGHGRPGCRKPADRSAWMAHPQPVVAPDVRPARECRPGMRGTAVSGGFRKPL